MESVLIMPLTQTERETDGVKGLMALTTDFQQPDDMRCTWFTSYTLKLIS